MEGDRGEGRPTGFLHSPGGDSKAPVLRATPTTPSPRLVEKKREDSVKSVVEGEGRKTKHRSESVRELARVLAFLKPAGSRDKNLYMYYLVQDSVFSFASVGLKPGYMESREEVEEESESYRVWSLSDYIYILSRLVSDPLELEACSEKFVEAILSKPQLYVAIVKDMHIISKTSNSTGFSRVVTEALRFSRKTRDYIRLVARLSTKNAGDGDRYTGELVTLLLGGRVLAIYLSNYNNPLEIVAYGFKSLKTIAREDVHLSSLSGQLVPRKTLEWYKCSESPG